MEPEGSLPHSQVSATCPYPEPDQSNSCHPTLLNIHLNIILVLPNGLFPSAFLTKTLYTPLLYPITPIRAACLAHLILIDLISRTILDQQLIHTFVISVFRLSQRSVVLCILLTHGATSLGIWFPTFRDNAECVSRIFGYL